MEINKDFSSSKLVNDYFAAFKDKGLELPDPNREVGRNGYYPGQTFHATGLVIVPATDTLPTPYIGVATTEGVTLSLKSLMGLSSVRGYHLDGSYPSEFLTKEGEKATEQIEASVISGFRFDKCFQPSTRNFLEFASECEANKFFEGKTITYMGTVVRPFVAKKASNPTFSEQYKEGFARCITAKLWGVE